MAERLEFNSWGFPAIFVLAARIQWFSYQGRGGAKIIQSVLLLIKEDSTSSEPENEITSDVPWFKMALDVLLHER